MTSDPDTTLSTDEVDGRRTALLRPGSHHLMWVVAIAVAVLQLSGALLAWNNNSAQAGFGEQQDRWQLVADEVDLVVGTSAAISRVVINELALGTGRPVELGDHLDGLPDDLELIRTTIVVNDPDHAPFARAATKRVLEEMELMVATGNRALELGLADSGDQPWGELARMQIHAQAVEEELARIDSIIDDNIRDIGHSESDRSAFAAWLVLAIAAIAAAMVVLMVFVNRRVRRTESSLIDELETEKALMSTIVEALPDAIAWKDESLRAMGGNGKMRRLLRAGGIEDWIGKTFATSAEGRRIHPFAVEMEKIERGVIESGAPVMNHRMNTDQVGGSRAYSRTIVPLDLRDGGTGVVSITQDITELIEMERFLAHGSRLESIGQLAAGVAHEINTPVQYVRDNASFLADAFDGMSTAVEQLVELGRRADDARVDELLADTDMDFLSEEIPRSLEQSSEGLNRVAEIVRAMKDFAHPGDDTVETDLNRAIETTIDVTRNEWRYVADLVAELDPSVGSVICNEGQIKQVLLNMIVNAAHAVHTAQEQSTDSEVARGRIVVSSARRDDMVDVEISDSGTGISQQVQRRIFDPFYTTKPVGKGTGQGLALARDVVHAHGGTIAVDSTLGVGTTFTLSIPVAGPGQDDQASPSAN